MTALLAMISPLEAVADAWASRVASGLAEALQLSFTPPPPPPLPAPEALYVALAGSSGVALAGSSGRRCGRVGAVDAVAGADALAAGVAERVVAAWRAALPHQGARAATFDIAPATVAAAAAPVCGRLVAGRDRLMGHAGPTSEAGLRLWLDGLAELLWRGLQPQLAPLLRSARVAAQPGPPVACRTYSPALQLAALGLADLARLRGPVLDLGCGPTGRLVGHLREQGIAAVGMDRDLPDDAPAWLREGDWMEMPATEPVWGTITSHLGFSLHFLRQHLICEAGAAACARATLRLLASLLPGGRLAIVPALPFFEPLLPPEDFRVEHHPLPAELACQPALQALQARLGLGLGHATHLVRR